MREGRREEGKKKGGRDRERLWEVEVTGRKEELEKREREGLAQEVPEGM